MNKSPRKALIRTSFFLFSVLLTILSPIYLTANAKAQYAVTYNGWTTIKMSDKVEFQIPPTMEIQSDKYRSLSPTLEKTLNLLWSSVFVTRVSNKLMSNTSLRMAYNIRYKNAVVHGCMWYKQNAPLRDREIPHLDTHEDKFLRSSAY